MSESHLVGRGGINLAAGRFVGIIAAFFITILMTRMLGPDSYGIFSYAISIPLFVISILNNTVNVGLLKFVPEFIKNGETGKIKHLFWKVIKISLFGSLASIALVIPISFFIPETNLILISLPFILVGVISFNIAMLFYSSKKLYVFAVEYFSTKIFQVVLVIPLITLLGVIGAIFSYTIATFFTLILLLYLYFRNYRNIKKLDSGVGYRKLLSISTPYGISKIFSTATEKTSIFMLTYFTFLFGIAAVGFYSLAVGILFVINTMATSIPEASIPTLVQYTNTKNKKGVQSGFNSVLKYTFVLIIPIIISTPFLMEKFVKLVYGPEFIAASGILTILNLGLIFLIFYKLVTPVLVSKSKFRLFMKTEILVFCILAILSFLLIPTYGPSGAAISYITAIGIGYSLLFYKGIKLVDIKFPIKMTLKILCASFIFGLFAFLPLSPYPYLFISMIAVTFIYFGLLFGLKVLTRYDVSYVISITPFGKRFAKKKEN